jgi:thymidylate synthase
MLQGIVARALAREVGGYRHFVGSMHLYDKHRALAQSLVDEGYQARIEMPPMPLGDPWLPIGSLLAAEARIRTGEVFDANLLGLDPYWSDFIRILQIYFSSDNQRIEALNGSMSFPRYGPYISSRIGRDAK